MESEAKGPWSRQLVVAPSFGRRSMLRGPVWWMRSVGWLGIATRLTWLLMLGSRDCPFLIGRHLLVARWLLRSESATWCLRMARVGKSRRSTTCLEIRLMIGFLPLWFWFIPTGMWGFGVGLAVQRSPCLIWPKCVDWWQLRGLMQPGCGEWLPTLEWGFFFESLPEIVYQRTLFLEGGALTFRSLVRCAGSRSRPSMPSYAIYGWG